MKIKIMAVCDRDDLFAYMKDRWKKFKKVMSMRKKRMNIKYRKKRF